MNLNEFYELAEQLCEHAMGVNADYAAVDLIANHRVWLLRRDFAPFIQRGHHFSGEPMAAIRWRAAHTALQRGQLPCSGSCICLVLDVLSPATAASFQWCHSLRPAAPMCLSGDHCAPHQQLESAPGQAGCRR